MVGAGAPDPAPWAYPLLPGPMSSLWAALRTAAMHGSLDSSLVEAAAAPSMPDITVRRSSRTMSASLFGGNGTGRR